MESGEWKLSWIAVPFSPFYVSLSSFSLFIQSLPPLLPPPLASVQRRTDKLEFGGSRSAPVWDMITDEHRMPSS